MRLGVVPVIDRTTGGTRQYSEAVLSALTPRPSWLQVVLVIEQADHHAGAALREAGWDVAEAQPHPFLEQVLGGIARAVGQTAACRVASIVRAITGIHVWPFSAPAGVRLMLYPSPWHVASGLPVPYLVAIHDVQHRLQPQFPEVSANGEAERRERLFGPAIAHASAILVDSAVGREDVLACYRQLTTPGRVHVLPFVPPPYLAAPTSAEGKAELSALGLPERYLLMPAQFWPHKNHLRVAEAVAALRAEQVRVTVVMTGSDTGDVMTRTLAELRAYIESAGLEDQLRLVGYVEDSTIAALYANSVGVLLPTFFGPTNIPVIEAWAMGVPVLSSDIRGIREQCGDAAILVDPASVPSIADGIRRLWTDEPLRRRLVDAGRERIQAHDPAAFRRGLLGIIAAAFRTAGMDADAMLL